MNNQQTITTAPPVVPELSRRINGVNWFMVVDCGLLLVFAISVWYSVCEGQREPGDLGLPNLSAEAVKPEQADLAGATLPLKPFEEYELEISRRALFGFNLLGTQAASQQVAATAGTAVVETLPAFYQGLQLRGIVLDGKSQAILQDPGTRQSFFVSQGDQLKDALVKEITAEKVVLEYGGQMLEIRQQPAKPGAGQLLVK